MMKSFRLPDPPPELRDRILSSIRAVHQPAPRASGRYILTAAFVALLGVLWLILGPLLHLGNDHRAAHSDRVQDHVVAVGAHAVWVYRAGFSLVAEGHGADIAPAVFKAKRPIFLLAYWDGDFEHLWREECTLHFNRTNWVIVRDHGLPQTFSTGVIREERDPLGTTVETLGPLVKYWPHAPSFPMLDLQKGILVIDEKGNRDAALAAAVKSDRREIKAAALHFLRYEPRTESVDQAISELSSKDPRIAQLALDTLCGLTGAPRQDPVPWWDARKDKAVSLLEKRFLEEMTEWGKWQAGFTSNLPFIPRAPNGRERALYFLEHEEPSVRRQAAFVASNMGLVESIPKLLVMTENFDFSSPQFALMVVTRLNPNAALPHLLKGLEDPQERVRMQALTALPPPAWQEARIREKIDAALGGKGILVRYEWRDKDISEAIAAIAKDAGVRIAAPRPLKGSITAGTGDVDWRELLVVIAATLNYRVVWESPQAAQVISGQGLSDSPGNPFK